MEQLDQFIEVCQEATYCMRHPQQDSAGWFFWVVWGLIIALMIGGFVGSLHTRRYVWRALTDPTEYRGRMGRDEFSMVYFGLQMLRGCVVVGCMLLCAIFGKSWASLAVIFAGIVLLIWFTAALYSSIVRRGHDFAFEGKESLLAYLSYLSYLSRRYRMASFSQDKRHTWRVMCDNKGNPYANCFGSAPEENNYLIPPEKDWRSENREFPNVWDEADWKSMKRWDEERWRK